MNTIRRVAIIGGNRIPFARSNTAYAHASNQEMLTATLQGLIDRYNLHGERLGDVAVIWVSMKPGATALMVTQRAASIGAVLCTMPTTPALDNA